VIGRKASVNGGKGWANADCKWEIPKDKSQIAKINVEKINIRIC